MITIAICDDDIELREKLKKSVRLIINDIGDEADIFSYMNGEDLIAAIQEEKTSIDILLLDIDIPGISGLEVAKALREAENDIIIIFISSYDNYVFESLEYSPFRFIRKSRINQELKLALRAAHTLHSKNIKKYIFVRGDEGEFKVEQSTICYFELSKRKLYVHLDDNRVISTWKTMKEFYEDFSEEDFVKIHSGCAVNLKYVKGCSNTEIMLDSGETLYASRSGIKTLREKLARYWSECV